MARHTNRHGIDGQLAFDIDAMIHAAEVKAAPPWQGAPLHFTVDYYPRVELDAAFAHWQFLNGGYGSYARSHMWHRSIAAPNGAELGEHCFDLFSADLRCQPESHGRPHSECACVGDLTYQAICEPCSWHVVTVGENTAVESWHDHALTGWRQLPIVPARIRTRDQKGRLSKPAHNWIAEHYPEAMQVPGAPIITERDAGTRHVPGRSPWGGYDLSATALAHTTVAHTTVDPGRRVEPAARTRRTGLNQPAPRQAAPDRAAAGQSRSVPQLEL